MSDHQYLVQYQDYTVDTTDLTTERAAELATRPGIRDVRKLKGYSKLALDEDGLQFAGKIGGDS